MSRQAEVLPEGRRTALGHTEILTWRRQVCKNQNFLEKETKGKPGVADKDTCEAQHVGRFQLSTGDCSLSWQADFCASFQLWCLMMAEAVCVSSRKLVHLGIFQVLQALLLIGSSGVWGFYIWAFSKGFRGCWFVSKPQIIHHTAIQTERNLQATYRFF